MAGEENKLKPSTVLAICAAIGSATVAVLGAIATVLGVNNK
jgi:hypothetical protein